MSSPPNLFSVLLAVALALGVVPPASGQPTRKLDRVLNDAVQTDRDSGKRHEVIVRARPGYGSWLRAQLLKDGVEIQSEHPSIDGMALALTATEINTLCGGGAVEHCSSNPVVTATAALPKPGGPATPGKPAADSKAADPKKKDGPPATAHTLLGNIGLGASVTGGTGVTVALIDSGIEPSSAFHGRIKAFYDYTDVRKKAHRPYDDYGHGTHVAGLIGGLQTAADKDFQGVAPGVEFVVLKVLNSKGSGRTSDVISAIELAVANRRGASPLNIDIINLSLGHPIFESAATDPLVRAVERAAAAGVIVVASAGNFGTNPDTGEVGYAGTTSPGNAPSAITVGAYDHKASVSRLDDRVTAYSSRGPTWLEAFSKPDIVAPGHLLSSDRVFKRPLRELSDASPEGLLGQELHVAQRHQHGRGGHDRRRCPTARRGRRESHPQSGQSPAPVHRHPSARRRRHALRPDDAGHRRPQRRGRAEGSHCNRFFSDR